MIVTAWPFFKKIIGLLFIAIGLLALLTPLTPGSWLVIVGAELLGFRLLFLTPIRKWFSSFPWRASPSTAVTLPSDPRTRRLLWWAIPAFGIVILFVLVVSWRIRQKTFRVPAISAPPLASSALPTTRLRVGSQELTVEFARTPSEQARGLSGRDALDLNGGMLFLFPARGERIFWMKETRIPLDILWIREESIVGVTANVQPEPGVPEALLRRYFSPGPVDHALEVNAGWSARYGVRVGDPVRLLGGGALPAGGGDHR